MDFRVGALYYPTGRYKESPSMGESVHLLRQPSEAPNNKIFSGVPFWVLSVVNEQVLIPNVANFFAEERTGEWVKTVAFAKWMTIGVCGAIETFRIPSNVPRGRAHMASHKMRRTKNIRAKSLPQLCPVF